MESSEVFGREDDQSDVQQLPSFRGPRPRMRSPVTEGPASASTDPFSSPLNLELLSAPPPSLQPIEIEVAKERVKALMERMQRRTLEDALEIGREALRVSRALSHGEVGRWLKETFGERRARTVYNWIGMAEYAEAHPQEFATFSILDASAVYLLTAPKTPPTAVEAIIWQIDAGSVPTVDKVREEISRAKKDVLQRTRPITVSRDENASGSVALRAVAQLIPSDHRERAIALLREAIAADCGLHDLIRSLTEA